MPVISYYLYALAILYHSTSQLPEITLPLATGAHQKVFKLFSNGKTNFQFKICENALFNRREDLWLLKNSKEKRFLVTLL